LGIIEPKRGVTGETVPLRVTTLLTLRGKLNELPPEKMRRIREAVLPLKL
jgi:hypothetical protein